MRISQFKQLSDRLLPNELDAVPEFITTFDLDVPWVAEHLDLFMFWFKHSEYASAAPLYPNWGDYFSYRVANALRKEGILTPDELYLYTKDELRNIKGIGQAGMQEINRFFKTTADPYELFNDRHGGYTIYSK